MAKKLVDTPQIIFSPDDKLAHHLEQAEIHLIEAVKLFARKHRPDRHPDFVARLTRAQETVTWLYREELIRIRGPIQNAMAVSIKRRK